MAVRLWFPSERSVWKSYPLKMRERRERRAGVLAGCRSDYRFHSVYSQVGRLVSAGLTAKACLSFNTDALLFRLLVALITWRDLLLFAKHLFVATISGSSSVIGS